MPETVSETVSEETAPRRINHDPGDSCACHKVQDPALCFMVACVLCDRVFERVANFGMLLEYHLVAIGLKLASEANGFPCCAEAGSDEAKDDDV